MSFWTLKSTVQSPAMSGMFHPVVDDWEKPTPPVRFDGVASVGGCVPLLFVAEEVAADAGVSEEVPSWLPIQPLVASRSACSLISSVRGTCVPGGITWVHWGSWVPWLLGHPSLVHPFLVECVLRGADQPSEMRLTMTSPGFINGHA